MSISTVVLDLPQKCSSLSLKRVFFSESASLFFSRFLPASFSLSFCLSFYLLLLFLRCRSLTLFLNSFILLICRRSPRDNILFSIHCAVSCTDTSFFHRRVIQAFDAAATKLFTSFCERMKAKNVGDIYVIYRCIHVLYICIYK